MVPELDFKVETLKGTGKRVHKKDIYIFSLLSDLCSLFSVLCSNVQNQREDGRRPISDNGNLMRAFLFLPIPTDTDTRLSTVTLYSSPHHSIPLISFHITHNPSLIPPITLHTYRYIYIYICLYKFYISLFIFSYVVLVAEKGRREGGKDGKRRWAERDGQRSGHGKWKSL